jgi:toxin-antitoxin system PIN domain toxin
VTAFLADGNLLIALVVSDHVHHGMAVEWFEQTEPNLATCPITEGTLIRFLVREGVSAAAATGLLDTVRDQDWHRFWPADLPLVGAQFPGVVGHRQVTGAYLVALAIHHGGRLVTLDRGIAAVHGDAVELLPT